MIKDEHVIDNKSKSVKTQKFMPLLSNSVDFIHLGIKSKKPAQFIFHLNPSNFDLSRTRIGHKNTILHFRNPKTGLFDVIKPDDVEMQTDQLPIDKLASIIKDLIKQAWHDKYQYLKMLRDLDSDVYAVTYKDLNVIDGQIKQQITSGSYIKSQIHKDLSMIPDRGLLPVNEQLVFKDTIITKNSYASTRLPYENPQDHIPAIYSRDEVYERDEMLQWLRTFMDNENLNIFLWFMGAVLSNQDACQISKMLIVDGNKEQTKIFMNAVCHVLFDGFYRVVKSPTSLFNSQKRYLSYDCAPLHLTIFTEDDWLKQINNSHRHLKFGLPQFKAMVLNGSITLTAKADEPLTRVAVHTFYICLSDCFPDVSRDVLTDQGNLNRRLLPLTLKSDSIDKSTGYQYLVSYLDKHRQALADLCYRYYHLNESKFVHIEYNQFKSVKALPLLEG